MIGDLGTLRFLQRKRRAGGGTESTTRSDPDSRIDESSAGVLCARCAAVVTTKDQAIEINGSHRHTFANPHGLVFHIACYSTAKGCREAGQESMEFTWFAGYGWTVQACASCGVHLGWEFRSRQRTFYGLVCDRLIEDRGAPACGS